MANASKINVKKELLDPRLLLKCNTSAPSDRPISVIDLSDSDSDSGDDNVRKKRRTAANAVLPLGFLDPLPQPLHSNEHLPLALPATTTSAVSGSFERQFWKAGDFDDVPSGDCDYSNGGMDHVRVHPRFLHSNATSHKWALGAFAELLDNSLDEVCNGATYISIDMVQSKKDGSKMLLIEDDGGGMDPDKMRQCISLGYSAKSKMADTIGQYGNGFKTSTMRLGADVIVFSRCRGKNGLRSTQSIGLLSYTFLRSTRKEDIVVPMLDYERRGQDLNRIIRTTASNWDQNVETILQWSPFSNENDLLRQFNHMQDQGTRIIIYNLWDDDEGQLELDFDTDPRDIQIRGVNRDEKNIEMAKKYPNSKHFLTYRHSLRSYAAILYLRIPPGFRIILRGEDVEHHNIVNDIMMSQETSYRPKPGVGDPKNSNMVVTVTVGFVKDAKCHIDVQGFSVYHKNRLIKPFWRLWHSTGSDGRGVIGVLEADFIEPAHDKQDFERTTVLARLEARLIQMAKTYWYLNCHHVGYARKFNKNGSERGDKNPIKIGDKGSNNGHLNGKRDAMTYEKQRNFMNQSLSSAEYLTDDARLNSTLRQHIYGSSMKEIFRKDEPPRPSGLQCDEGAANISSAEMSSQRTRNSASQENGFTDAGISSSISFASLVAENLKLQERLQRTEEEIRADFLNDLQNEKERSKSLEAQLEEATKRYEELSKEQEALVDLFSEERLRHDMEQENLRNQIREKANTIQQLLDKLRALERKGI